MYQKIALVVCFATVLFVPLRSGAQEIVAHRGAAYDAPENTIASFNLAWEQGADAIEADFHLTSDQQIVCIHDGSTGRVCPNRSSLKIDKTDLSTLQKLDVGSWKDSQFSTERIPTLAAVLAIVPPDKKIFIEIKTGPEILPVLKEQLAKCSLKPDQIVLICFNSSVIKQARILMPQYQANWLVAFRRQRKKLGDFWSPSVEQVLDTLADNNATGLGAQGRLEVINQQFIKSVKDAGVEFHTWTIDDPKMAEQLKLLGTLSLTTNRPSFLRSKLKPVMSEMNSKHQ